ncbi:MAG: hypothetical protein GC137_10050 [Alphaproteobacteria bacterium]|nr:hypothetical protein [Alphaproteobacteria bacterium]
MTSFDTEFYFLKGPVGNNLQNDPDDVRNTKTRLGTLGYFEEDTQNDYITRELDDGIKRFQTDHRLQVDGKLFPGGETENTIVAQIEPARTMEYKERDDETRLPYMLERISADDNTNSPAAAAFGQPAQNVDATGRQLREIEIPRPDRKQQIDTFAPKQKSIKIREAEEEARNSLEFFERNDRKLSAKFLKHYLDGSGEPLKITAEEIDNSPRLSDAITQNNKRFEDSITKGLVDPKFRDGKFIQRVKGTTPSPFKDQILQLKDGETIDLVKNEAGSSPQSAGDVWDKDLTPNPLLSVIPGLDKDPDQTLSTGSVKVRSLGNLQATRKGNKVEITGDVFHTLIDRYDFDLETSSEKLNFKNEKLLATEGNAKPFQVTGVKPQKVQAVLTLDQSRIKDWNFKWTNTKF